jgi:hypothetical protein
MRNPTTAPRVFRVILSTVAVALLAGACGQVAPCAQGSNAGAGQNGTSSGSAGGVQSSAGSQGGFAAVGSAAADSSSGLSPDQVAQYCKNSDLYVPEDPSGRPSWVTDTPKLIELRKYTPVQLQPDVQLMIIDYQALNRQQRVLPQVKDELDVSYKRLMDFRSQICEVH